MLDFYPQIKALHIGLVFASVGLFAFRGAMVLAGSSWVLSGPLRFLSFGIDTALLTAGLMLFTILPGAVFANHWLTVKLSLLVVYVVLGSFAFRLGRSRRVRVACYLGALAVIGTMYGIARHHHPLGWLSG
jgi:uncharacterized membrane protein SirB2